MMPIESIVAELNAIKRADYMKRQSLFLDLLPRIAEFVTRCEGEPVRIDDNVARLRMLKDLVACPYGVGLMEFICEL